MRTDWQPPGRGEGVTRPQYREGTQRGRAPLQNPAGLSRVQPCLIIPPPPIPTPAQAKVREPGTRLPLKASTTVPGSAHLPSSLSLPHFDLPTLSLAPLQGLNGAPVQGLIPSPPPPRDGRDPGAVPTRPQLCTWARAGVRAQAPRDSSQPGRAEPEREQAAAIQGLWVWGKRREIRAEGAVEARGQRTNRQTFSSCRSASPPHRRQRGRSPSSPLPRAEAHRAEAAGWDLRPLGACRVFGAFLQALKELILLQVVVAGRGASAGLTHTPSALISASLPGESLLGQVSCQAGQGSGSCSRSLLPAAQGAAGGRGPLRTGSLRQGSPGRVVGPVSFRRVTPLFPPPSLRIWARPSPSTQAQPRPRLARLFAWKFTRLQNGIAAEMERSRASTSWSPLTPRKSTLPLGR